MMLFGSLISASRYFGFSIANFARRSWTSPRVIFWETPAIAASLSCDSLYCSPQRVLTRRLEATDVPERRFCQVAGALRVTSGASELIRVEMELEFASMEPQLQRRQRRMTTVS